MFKTVGELIGHGVQGHNAGFLLGATGEEFITSDSPVNEAFVVAAAVDAGDGRIGRVVR